MADSHYIPKCLLRNWEHRPGQLRYFDFKDGRIKRSSAKSMYVSEAPFPEDVEKWLGRTIETPLGEHIAKFKAAVASRPSTMPAPSLREAKALTLATILQGPRTALASGFHGRSCR